MKALEELRSLIQGPCELSEGFTGLRHWRDSDSAIWLMEDVQEAIAKILKKSVRQEGGIANTSGRHNVLLVMMALFDKKEANFMRPPLRAVVGTAFDLVDKEIEELEADTSGDPDVKKFLRLLNKLKTDAKHLL